LRLAEMSGVNVDDRKPAQTRQEPRRASTATNLPRIYLIGPSAKSPTRSMSGIFTGE
jgi:hypothetical protein